MFKNIIVRMPNWIGDLVMAIPVLAEIRSRFPGAKITAMCPTPLHDLLLHDPNIDDLFSFSRVNSEFASRQDYHQMMSQLSDGKYDLGVLLTNSFSSAWWFWLSHVKRRLGYAVNWRSFILTDPVEPPEEKIHQVEFYQYLLQPLGIPIRQVAPKIYVTDDEIAGAKKILQQHGYPDQKPLIGMNPGAAFGQAKCWPPARFRALTQRFLQDPDQHIVFFGDAASKGLIQEICIELPSRVIDLAGITNIRELACLIQECDVLVSNDSGPMHMAAALETPVVALFGSTDDIITGPFGQKGASINKHVSCSPCFQRVCPKDFRCMNQIEVDEVAKKTIERMKQRVSNVF